MLDQKNHAAAGSILESLHHLSTMCLSYWSFFVNAQPASFNPLSSLLNRFLSRWSKTLINISFALYSRKFYRICLSRRIKTRLAPEALYAAISFQPPSCEISSSSCEGSARMKASDKSGARKSRKRQQASLTPDWASLQLGFARTGNYP